MSRADNMFEKLGYQKMIKTIENGKFNSTEYKNDDYSICFEEMIEEVVLTGFKAIDMEELKAINEKVKELGWDE